MLIATLLNVIILIFIILGVTKLIVKILNVGI